MVDGERIVSEALRLDADLIGLSGLITPSLAEMADVARLMEERGMRTPLLVGGAAASALHTALRIAPCYSGPTFYTHDAASLPSLAARLIDPREAPETIRLNAIDQQQRRDGYTARQQQPAAAPMPYAPDTPDTAVSAAPAPAHPGMHTLHPAVSELRPLINWKAFTAAWRTSSCSAEATHLKDDAESVLDRLEDRGARHACCSVRPIPKDSTYTSAPATPASRFLLSARPQAATPVPRVPPWPTSLPRPTTGQGSSQSLQRAMWPTTWLPCAKATTLMRPSPPSW